MKFNWGHYIFIVFAAFVLLVLFMVFKSYQRKNELVAEDYYEKELQFQEVIEKRKRADALEKNITWNQTAEGLLLSYPGNFDEIQGIIQLMRPSDKTKDLETFIQPDERGQQLIAGDKLIAGKYLITLDWSGDGVGYYTDGVLFITK